MDNIVSSNSKYENIHSIHLYHVTISDLVRGKDIVLIDDLYTKTVNIDEDAIQALHDNGARSVIFYSVGKTLSRQDIPPAADNSTVNFSDDDDLPF